jgi:hypothetical protein
MKGLAPGASEAFLLNSVSTHIGWPKRRGTYAVERRDT